MQYFFSIFIFFFLLGCATSNLTSIQHKTSIQEKYSKWFDREEKLPLTIVAVGFDDPKTRSTYEYKALKKMINAIAHDRSLLPDSIALKYTTIDFKDFSTSNYAKKKFNVIFSNKQIPKETLNDILRPDKEKPSAELFIFLDQKQLQNGDLLLQGYKTIKQQSKLRNSALYSLRKKRYGLLPLKEKKKVLYNSILTLLTLSIPDYKVIDTKKFLENQEYLQLITPLDKKKYHFELWKNTQLHTLIQSKKDLSILEHDVRSDGNFIPLKSIRTYPFEDILLYKNILIGYKAFSPDIYLFDLKKQMIIKTLHKHKGYISTISLLPKENILLSASEDGTIIIWDLKSFKILAELKDNSLFFDISFDKNAIYALFRSHKKLKLWNIYTKKVLKTINLNVSKSFLISKEKAIFIKDDQLQLFDILHNKTIVSKRFPAKITNAFLLKDKDQLYISYKNKLVKLSLPTLAQSTIIKTSDDIEYFSINEKNGFSIIKLPVGNYFFVDLRKKKIVKKIYEDLFVKKVLFSKNADKLYMISRKQLIILNNYPKLFQRLKIEKLKKIYSLKQTIKTIYASKGYIDNNIKLIYFTTAFCSKDIDTLKRYGFLQDRYRSKYQMIHDIEKSLDYSLYSPLANHLSKELRNKNGFKVFKDNATIAIKYKEPSIQALYFSKRFLLQDVGFKKEKEFYKEISPSHEFPTFE